MRIMAAVLASWIAATPALAIWREASSPHFVIYSEENEAALRTYAERLERLDAALRLLLPPRTQPTSADRLTIYQLKDAAAVQRVMGSRGNGAAGAYKSNGEGSIALTARAQGNQTFDLTAQTVLLHEYAHHFMLRNFTANYPLWFREGFAEFISTARFEKDGGVGIGLPAIHRAYSFQDANPLPLNRMLADDLPNLTQQQLEATYAYGWLLMHYLNFSDDRRGQLTRYLADINRGVPAGKAAADAFGDIPKLNTELNVYLRRGSMAFLPIPASQLPVGTVTIRTVSPAEAAIIPIRIESKYGVGDEEARQLVPLARQAAAPYPDDPAAQCMLAEAEYDADNLDGAEQAADRVLAKNPNAYCALLYKGRAIFGRATGSKAAAGDPVWAEARKWFSRANRADPDQAMPPFLFYSTYAVSGAAPTANATDALFMAAELAPDDASIRRIAAIQLLRSKQTDRARTMLAPIANPGHGSGGNSGFIRGLYERIGTVPPETLADELARGPASSGSGNGGDSKG